MNDETDTIAALGQRVREIRTMLQLSQKKMAELLGISHNYISDIETGKANPGPEFFFKLFRVFNVDLNYVFMGTGDMFYREEAKAREIQCLPLKAFDFTEDLESIEQVAWLMVNSTYFKNMILGTASRMILTDEILVRESIRRTQKKIKGEETNENER